MITNWAEISEDNSALLGVVDADSTPDGINFNQGGETDDLADDNIVNESGLLGGDEDDHDPAQVMVGQVFDLALTNVYNSYVDNDGDGQLSPGDDVIFDISVFNQGTLDAYDIGIANYLPEGTTLNDPTWDDSDGDGVANLINPIGSVVAGGTSPIVPITVRINEDFQGLEIVDVAEITFATSVDDSGINTADIDSTPDATCLLYTSPSPRDRTRSRMPSSA